MGVASTVFQGIGLGMSIVGGLSDRNAARQADYQSRLHNARALEYEAWGQTRSNELQARGLESEAAAALEKAVAAEANVAAQLAEADAAEAVGRHNLASARADARAVETTLDHSLARHALNVDRVLGAQRVAFAKGGVAVDEGTPLAVAASTMAEAEADAEAMIEAGAAEAARYRNRGELAMFESGLLADRARHQASLDRLASWILVRSSASLLDLAGYSRQTGEAGAGYLRETAGLLVGAGDDAARRSIIGTVDQGWSVPDETYPIPM